MPGGLPKAPFFPPHEEGMLSATAAPESESLRGLPPCFLKWNKTHLGDFIFSAFLLPLLHLFSNTRYVAFVIQRFHFQEGVFFPQYFIRFVSLGLSALLAFPLLDIRCSFCFISANFRRLYVCLWVNRLCIFFILTESRVLSCWLFFYFSDEKWKGNSYSAKFMMEVN